MSMLLAASYDHGLRDIRFDDDLPYARLSRYWDKLERQLRRHVRPVDADESDADDGVEVSENEMVDGHGEYYQCESDIPLEHDRKRDVFYRPAINDQPDSRFDPARMSESDFASWEAAEVWLDSQPVIDWLRRFCRDHWRIRPIAQGAERIAYSRMTVADQRPISSTVVGWETNDSLPVSCRPAEIIDSYDVDNTPCYVGAPADKLGDHTRYASESFRDLAIYLRFLAKRLDLEVACGS